jgi:hypothetical protein
MKDGLSAIGWFPEVKKFFGKAKNFAIQGKNLL